MSATSRAARIQAGVLGPALEAMRLPEGYAMEQYTARAPFFTDRYALGLAAARSIARYLEGSGEQEPRGFRATVLPSRRVSWPSLAAARRPASGPRASSARPPAASRAAGRSRSSVPSACPPSRCRGQPSQVRC